MTYARTYRADFGPFPAAGPSFQKAAVACAASLLTVLLSAVLITTGSGETYGSKVEFLSGCSFAALAFAVLVSAALSRRSILDDPIYLAVLAYSFFIGIGPLVGVFAGVAPASSGSSDAYMVVTECWLGLVGLGLGYGLSKLLGLVRARMPRPKSGLALNRELLKQSSTALTVLGLAGIFLYLSSVGGLSHLLTTPYGVRDIPSGFYAGAYDLLRPGLFLLTAWVLSQEKPRFWWVAVLLLYCGLDLLWFGPLRGSRHHLITLVLTLTYLARAAWLGRRRVLLPHRWLIAVAVFLVLVWGGLRVYSLDQMRSMQTSRSDFFELAEQDTKAGLVTALYSPYDTFARIVISVPDSMPYLKGVSFYESLTVLVPRQLWVSKPESFGDWMTVNFYGLSPSRGNTVPTWPGELYLNFGTLGLLLGMFACGAACAWIGGCKASDRETGSERVPKTLIYAVSFPIVLDLVHEGSNGAIWYAFTNILPVYLVLQLAKYRAMRPLARDRYDDRT